jgi:UDP-glucose 4-epimerase
MASFRRARVRVLITGGMGVIGAMTTRKFVKEGHRPVIMARHMDRDLIGPIEDRVDVELADVQDFPRLISIIQNYNITHVVHTAALIGALSTRNPPQSVHVNVIGTLNILEAARLMKVQRVVYTSSKGVYGYITGEYGHPTYKPLPEDHPKNPIRIYDSAKLMGEHMGQFYHRTYGLEFLALRFGMTFGPGKMARHGGMAATSRIVELPFAGKPVSFERGGDQKDDFIYTGDAGLAIYLAITAEKPRYTAYNVSMGVGYTLHDMAEAVKRVIPEADISIGPGLQFLEGPYHSIFDITKAREDLNFSSEFNMETAVADYVETLKQLSTQ